MSKRTASPDAASRKKDTSTGDWPRIKEWLASVGPLYMAAFNEGTPTLDESVQCRQWLLHVKDQPLPAGVAIRTLCRVLALYLMRRCLFFERPVLFRAFSALSAHIDAVADDGTTSSHLFVEALATTEEWIDH